MRNGEGTVSLKASGGGGERFANLCKINLRTETIIFKKNLDGPLTHTGLPLSSPCDGQWTM